MAYSDLLAHDLLSASEERVLLRAAQDGCDDSREKLLLANMRLIWSVAEAYTRHSDDVDTEDVMADGIVGLFTAIEKFDLNLPYRFSTFCVWHLRSAIGRSEFFHTHVRLPSHVLDDIRKVSKARATFMQAFGVMPTSEHLASETGLTEDKIEALSEIKQASDSVQSLYAPLSDDTDGEAMTLLDVLPDENAQIDFQQLEREQEVEWYLSHLNDFERRFIELRYGLTATNYDQPMSYKGIYKELYGDARGVDKSRTRLHPNDMVEFHDGILDKLKRLATAVKAGEIPGPADARAIMTGPGETLTLGI